MFPTLHHLAAIQKEGLIIWDAFQNVLFTSQIFLAFATADAVGMASLNGWVGHHEGLGCHLVCGMPGYHEPGAPHYYPALLRPTNVREDQLNSNHPDINFNHLPKPSEEQY